MDKLFRACMECLKLCGIRMFMVSLSRNFTGVGSRDVLGILESEGL